jgi:Fe2+ transport system protein B
MLYDIPIVCILKWCSYTLFLAVTYFFLTVYLSFSEQLTKIIRNFLQIFTELANTQLTNFYVRQFTKITSNSRVCFHAKITRIGKKDKGKKGNEKRENRKGTK